MRPVWLGVGGGVLALALGAAYLCHYTGDKLEETAMLRGEVPGALVEVGRVVGKRRLPQHPTQCEVEVVVGEHANVPVRDQADGADCARYEVGGEAELARTSVHAPLYLRHGTWTSPGNAAFDRGLLGIERGFAIGLGVAGLAMIALGLRRRRVDQIRAAR